MPGQTIDVSNVLTGLISKEFVRTYQKEGAREQELINAIAAQNVEFKQRVQTFAYYKSLPMPVRQDRGDAVTEKTFGSVNYTAEVFDFTVELPWYEDDEQDEQIGLLEHTQRASKRFSRLIPKIFLKQMIPNSADPDLLPSVPNAPDGAALHSATDGTGAARFQISGGNVQTGVSTATSAGIRSGFFNGRERQLQFLDTEGEPLLDEGDLDGANFSLIYPVTIDQVMREAFIQTRTLDTAALTNIILESGLKVKLWPTSRITGTDFYSFAEGADLRPLFVGNKSGLEVTPFNRSNSDKSRTFGVKGLNLKVRLGFGVNLPYATMKYTS